MLQFKKWILPVVLAGVTVLSACGNSGNSGSAVETTAQSDAVKEEGSTAAASEKAAEDNAYAVSEEKLSFIFAEKDLTVLNVWGTFCGPCINEMPELGAWAKEMPDNVQIIGLVADIAGETDEQQIDTAKTILEKTGADFQNIIPNSDFSDLLSNVVGVPTTYFINKEGKIVGKPIVGAQVSKYKSFVEGYLASLS